MSSMKTIVVAAAIVERNGRYLLTRRLAGTHLEGYWEFPGGKCESDESCRACVVREIREELGVDAMAGEEILTTTHEYGDRRVELHFLRCRLEGDPVPQLGQDIRWVARGELHSVELPPADAELVKILTAG